jgi:hypothetical protein
VVVPSWTISTFTCFTVEIWFSLEMVLPYGRYGLYVSNYFNLTYVVSSTITGQNLTYFAVNDGSGELSLVVPVGTVTTNGAIYQVTTMRQRTAHIQICLGKFGAYTPTCTLATTASGSETTTFPTTTLTTGLKIASVYFMAMYQSCLTTPEIVALFQYLPFVGPTVQNTARALFSIV